MTNHIGVFNDKGWEVIHTLGCPGDLLQCPITVACQELEAPPKIGWYELDWELDRRKNVRLLYGEQVPFGTNNHFSRRTGYGYKSTREFPGA